ncbi:hypothetical protein LO772_00130 [Yinghuangia sp. ASG 101]|uniref:hypothetical protein n=1 Tax=Yinghuangia sp. ASG 101 TaxID=2896848 RepID=UPI001E512FA5|nr:hypothetical protein [Yinghuangia sp. ASG 101]UGQ12062.1 hypothetical protein LO772_00130 [Yinghuangia sp. ASG 101]
MYPATGREGYPPVAFVFTGGTSARRVGRMNRLAAAARSLYAGHPYGYAGTTALNHHQVVPVVVASLERWDQDGSGGAGGAVWWRLGRGGWSTLTEALDNPDGDALLRTELAAHDRRERERKAVEREAERPACRTCEGRLTDERWNEVHRLRPWERNEGNAELCGPCRDAEQVRRDGEHRMRKRDAELTAALQARQPPEPDTRRAWRRRPRHRARNARGRRSRVGGER